MLLDKNYSTILRVAIPLMVSSFIQSIVLLTDSAFLARYSTLAFDAAGTAGLWYITLHMAFVGMSDGAQIAMARRVGENNPSGVARVFQSNFILLIAFACILTYLVQFVLPGWMMSSTSNKALASAEASFLSIRSYSFWASTVSMSIQAIYFATGKTALVLYSSLIVALTNIILDYLLIFGIGVFPEMGLEGAATASTLAEFAGMLFLLSTVVFGKIKSIYPIWKQLKISTIQLKENFKMGSPLVLQGFIALSIWTVFFTWIEQMGSRELTVSLNIRSIYFLAFVPIWGFAAATKTYISQYLGAKDYGSLREIQKRIQLMTMVILVITFHGALLYPEWMIRMINPREEFIEESALILRIVSGSTLLYGFASVYFQTISGSGNTRVTLIVECISTFLYLTSAYFLIKVWKAPIHIVWLVEYVYFIAMAVCSIVYLKWFNWTKEVKLE